MQGRKQRLQKQRDILLQRKNEERQKEIEEYNANK
jgi:hypothetical protein